MFLISIYFCKIANDNIFQKLRLIIDRKQK